MLSPDAFLTSDRQEWRHRHWQKNETKESSIGERRNEEDFLRKSNPTFKFIGHFLPLASNCMPRPNKQHNNFIMIEKKTFRVSNQIHPIIRNYTSKLPVLTWPTTSKIIPCAKVYTMWLVCSVVKALKFTRPSCLLEAHRRHDRFFAIRKRTIRLERCSKHSKKTCFSVLWVQRLQTLRRSTII